MKLLKVVVFILVLSAAGCQQPSIKKDIASKSSYKKYSSKTFSDEIIVFDLRNCVIIV